MWFDEAALAAIPDGSVYVRNELTATQTSLRRAVFKDTLARERNEALVSTLDLPYSDVCGPFKAPIYHKDRVGNAVCSQESRCRRITTWL